MESGHIISVYERVSRSIRSSINLLQLESAERMIALFKQLHHHPELTEKLQYEFLMKASELHYEEWKKIKSADNRAA
ncbi:MAG: hypothetical protein Fur0041_19440 [Bacteroidia bacterium]